MNPTETAPAAVNDISAALASARDAEQCIALASAAETAGDLEAHRACLHRAVALDRHSQAALLGLAALSMDEGDSISAFSFIEEAARCASLPAEVESLREQLFMSVREVSQLEHYLRAVGRLPVPQAMKPLSIVVVTSRFSEAAATSAATVENLVHGLIERGHRVRVLTGSAPDGASSGEPYILRTLRVGFAESGPATRDNTTRVRTAIAKSVADLVVVGHLDGLHLDLLHPALERELPVLHWMETARPSFPAEAMPREAHYWIAPASDWIGTALRNGGYETARMDTLYPGIRFERHFRLFLPDTQSLRVGFAAPLRPASGAETLVRALAELAAEGVDVSAELAGEVQDDAFLARLEGFVQEHELSERVRIVAEPVADRAAFFARHNVFVSAQQMPTAFDGAQLEAMAAGVVVVSSGVGDAKELVRDETDGLVFRAGDAQDLAARLRQLAREPETFSRLQRAGQGRAANFSVSNRVERLEALVADMQSALAATHIEDVPTFA